MISVIDIGTNSVLLLIAEEGADGTLHAKVERAQITRLGEGLAITEQLAPQAIERTMHVLAAYAEEVAKYPVIKTRVVGTAAMRRAKNAHVLTERAREELGVHVDVISGQEEATLTFAACVHDFGQSIAVIDVGGGSTEILAGHNALEQMSIPIGSVVLTEAHVHTDPITQEDFAHLLHVIDEALNHIQTSSEIRNAQKLIATAGTATTIGTMHLQMKSYDDRLVHGLELSRSDISAQIERLRRASVEQRKTFLGLHPQRADLILAGALIIQEAMIRFSFERLTISDRGLRWGVAYQLMHG